ncbi:ATP-binding protein [Actinomadura sp.]|uniref:sensor histidine kinase n=1 Tax=Actinomadura sp. TaxID=1989 RepID=UPI003350C424
MTRRLLLSYLSLTLVVLLGLEITLGTVFARRQSSDFSASVQRDAVMVAELIEEELSAGNAAGVAEIVKHYTDCMGGRVVVFDRGGRIVTDSAAGRPAVPAAAARNGPRGADGERQVGRAVSEALRNRPSAGTIRDRAGGGELMSAAQPVTVASKVRGAVWLTSATENTRTRIRIAWIALACIGVGVLLVVTVVAFALARWIIRPLNALEQATEQLAGGSLTDPPAADLGPPELRRLATSFNRTATRLQHLLRAQRAFAAEASHQLKSPLTALRLRLETLEFDLAPRARGTLDAAIAEIDRLSDMVRGLLALARLEDSATVPEPVDLDDVLRDRAATWAPLAAEQSVTIAVTGPPAGRVQAVPDALEQIVDNLLANALQIAPPGSTITLRTETRPRSGAPGDDGTVGLHVIDEGPGMKEEHRRRAFDRFWRAPDATHEGSGLGLAIVQRLVHVSGGDITLEEAPGGGLDAVVRLRPAADPPVARRFAAQPAVQA